MKKSFLLLSLGVALTLSACRDKKDEPRDIPAPPPAPAPAPTPETPAPAVAEIQITDGVLKLYPEERVGEDGVVTLEASVTEIGEGAFRGNTKIKTLVAPGLKKIDAAAFKGATALQLVDLSSFRPEGANVYPETAADAFEDTPSDKHIKLPANPSYTAWFSYIALHSFGTIEGIVPNIPAGAVIEEGVLKSLPKDWHAAANGLLVLPASVTKLGDYFLAEDKRSGVKLIYAPEVTEVGEGALSRSGIYFTHLPKLTKIGNGSYNEVSALKALNFPLLTEIGVLCFQPSSSPNKPSLSFLSLPSLKVIGQGSFAGSLEALETLVLGTMPTFTKEGFSDEVAEGYDGDWVPPLEDPAITFSGKRAAGATLLIPASALSSYGAQEGAQWEGFTIRLKK